MISQDPENLKITALPALQALFMNRCACIEDGGEVGRAVNEPNFREVDGVVSTRS